MTLNIFLCCNGLMIKSCNGERVMLHSDYRRATRLIYFDAGDSIRVRPVGTSLY